MLRPGNARLGWGILLSSLSFIGLLLGWAPDLNAQENPSVVQTAPRAVSHFRFPLILQSNHDGLLLGFDLRLGTELAGLSWEPNVGGAYGLGSHALHYHSGLTVADLLSVSYLDWPGSPVLGRDGERGFELGLSLSGLAMPAFYQPFLNGLTIRGFYGTLWQTPRESQEPAVSYLYVSDQIQWDLPLGAGVQLQGDGLLGAQLSTPRAEFFRTFSTSVQFTLDQTTLRIQYGQLDNPVGLADLRFRFGLRSYPATFQGDRLLVASLERRFDLFTVQFSRLGGIDLAGLLGLIGESVPVLLRAQGALFLEGGEVWLSGISQGGILSGWGVGLIFPDLSLRLEVTFNAPGEPRLHLQSALIEL